MAAFSLVPRLWPALHKGPSIGQLPLKFMLHWIPFFFIYGTAALCSATPLLTGVKWAWGLFNIGLAAFVCLFPRRDDALERGFYWGVILISALIWLEALAIYVFQPLTSVQYLGPGMPGSVSFLSIPIGYAQVSWKFMDLLIYRPNAFYYEPSYAGCALTFAFFILYFFDSKKTETRSGWLPAMAVSSVILTSSRSGILSILFFFLAASAALFFRREARPLLHSIFKSILITVVFIGLFSAAPSGRKYVQFLAGPLGFEMPARFHKKGSSEGDRLANMRDSLKLWQQHPLLGNGVLPQSETDNRGLSQFSMETWLEIGLESGTLGFLAFLFAVGTNMRLAWKNCTDRNLKVLVMAAWLTHFTVQFLLSQTFPRLDYWLIFFLSIRLLLNSGDTQKVSS